MRAHHAALACGAARLAVLAALLVLATAVTGWAAGLFYREVEKDGRLLVFGTASAYVAFGESGDLEHGISRVGYGEAGQTVVFDSEDAINLYNFKHGLPGEVFAKPKETPPKAHDDSSVKLGTTIFADYTYQAAPKVKDAGDNDVHLSLFEVRRAYINVTGNITDWVGFRVTPDIAPRFAETVTVKAPTGPLPARPSPWSASPRTSTAAPCSG